MIRIYLKILILFGSALHTLTIAQMKVTISNGRAEMIALFRLVSGMHPKRKRPIA
jgi:hypothetical protein